MGKGKDIDSANVQRIAKEITKVLELHSGGDPTLRYQIEQVASDIVIMRKVRKELFLLDSVMIAEDGSMGQTRTKVHPLCSEYREIGRRVQDGLDKLRMNRKSKAEKPGKDNALMDWMNGEE